MSLNREQDRTMIVSLHHVGLAKRYCDRVVALRDGELVFDGPTTALTPAFLRGLYDTAVDELMLDDLDPLPGPPAGPSLGLVRVAAAA
jgi:phosphonate transport system ATP-binding protein